MTRLSASEKLKLQLEREWAPLTFYYGLSFEELATMPHWARKVYLRALPRLLASQKLAALEVESFPHMTKQAQRSMLRRLNRQTGAPRQVTRPKSDADAKKALKAMGVKIEIED